LTRQSIEAFRQYIAIALMFGVQGVALRSFQLGSRFGYHAEAMLSPETRPLYQAVKDIVGIPPTKTRPYIWKDSEQALDEHIAAIVDDISQGNNGRISSALVACLSSIEKAGAR